MGPVGATAATTGAGASTFGAAFATSGGALLVLRALVVLAFAASLAALAVFSLRQPSF